MIEMGKYDLSAPSLETVSIEMKDLIRKLLQVKLSKRMTALEALKGPCFEQATEFEMECP